MSRSELLFDPRALARVANAVEWEQELQYYKDGHSNQEYYVQAMSILLERWMREFTLPDVLLALGAAGSGEWVDLIKQGLETIEAKVQQFRGFWEGLWYGANPTPKGTFVPYGPFRGIPFIPPTPPEQTDPDLRLLSIISQFMARLRDLSNDDFTKPMPVK